MRRLPVLFPWLSAAILLAMFGLAVTSMAGDAPTFDEQGFLVRGLAYLRSEENGGSRIIRVGHPLGLNALNAALLVNDPSVALPSDDPSWLERSFHRPAELFLWEIGNDVAHILFLARIPTIWLGLLLAAVSSRWAADIARGWRRRFDAGSGWHYLAALVTLLLAGLDPNILAHSRLVTTDVGLAAGATVAGYTVWRFARFPSRRTAALAGVGLGLMLNTKFTALLFVPWFVLIVVVAALALWRGQLPGATRRLFLMGLGIIPLVTFITLWAGHGFQISPLDVPLPIVGTLNGLTVPLAEYLGQLLDIGNRLAVSTPSFLLGQYSDSGWWYYFPIAFVLKTPLPVLLLLVWAALGSLMMALNYKPGGPTRWFDLVALLLPAGGFFAIALTTEINLGYRHLLPILPFLYVLIGVVVSRSVTAAAVSGRRLLPSLFALLMSWFVIASLWIYPHYLAFFNVIAGGPDSGWKHLVDSNLDWGQDLGRLSRWLEERGIEDVWLSYFGEARPEYYGITYRGLDSFPPRLMNPQARPFYPHAPAPGWYAISATTLQGVHFANHEQFAYFQTREPVAKIGYSIFVYNEPANGEPVDVILGDIQIDQIEPDDFALFNTNDVALRWVDPGQAFILPGSGRDGWAVLGQNDIHPQLATYVVLEPEWIESGTDAYRLFRVSPGVPIDDPIHRTFFLGDGEISFTGAQFLDQTDDTLQVLTTWRQEGPAMPNKIFVHVLDEAGNIAAQWDGLGVAWEGWRADDTLFQIHELPLEQLAEGSYRVVTGLYDPENFHRWQDAYGQNVIELGNIGVP